MTNEHEDPAADPPVGVNHPTTNVRPREELPVEAIREAAAELEDSIESPGMILAYDETKIHEFISWAEKL